MNPAALLLPPLLLLAVCVLLHLRLPNCGEGGPRECVGVFHAGSHRKYYQLIGFKKEEQKAVPGHRWKQC